MTLEFDLYWSFRSPYSYLATGRIVALARDYDVRVNVRPVYPLAVRVDGFFKNVNPMWLHYLLIDTVRIAEMHGLPFGAPRPDPIVMDMLTGDVPREQPHITRLMRLGQLAVERGRGLAFIDEVSRIIWSGKVDGWNKGPHLADAAARAGLDLDEMEATVARDWQRLDGAIVGHEQAQATAGHWGVPLMVFNGEPFFGQDRIDVLVWRMGQAGLSRRT